MYNKDVTSFNALIQKSIIDNWDHDALTDFKGQTLQFHDVARKIEKLHILFENSGIQKGDKIALCGRNSSQWAVAFIATLTYGAVAVPLIKWHLHPHHLKIKLFLLHIGGHNAHRHAITHSVAAFGAAAYDGKFGLVVLVMVVGEGAD